MAEQVLIQFRADKALKQEVTEIYERLGMDLPTAFRMFMTRSKMVKGLPFEATLPEQTITRVEAKNAFYELRKQATDVPEMSLDEINAEILAVRAEMYYYRHYFLNRKIRLLSGYWMLFLKGKLFRCIIRIF